ncbi:MAG: M28 family peptidase [Actinomycetota bacterium]
MRRNNTTFIGKILLPVLLSIAIQSFGQQTNSIVSTQQSVEESVKLAPCQNNARLEAVKKLFVQMGAKDNEITIEKFDKDKISNVLVKKKGKSAETIVIGAHYDKTDEGCGAIDNWTGISIIAHLFKTLRQIDMEKSYIFVAFDQEEKGLFGSDEMAKAIPKQNRQQYCAMVNFDSFGFTAPMSLQSASSSKMVLVAKKLAEENKFKFIDAAFEGADADSSSFKSRDIPSITFSGLDSNWQNYLHSKNDQLEKINMTSVYLGYRFGLMFVAKLDLAGCKENR